MKPVDLHHGAATDVGHVRKVNEDSFLVAPPVFVVADGMGGHSGGDVASRIVVEEFARLVEEGYDPLPRRRARRRDPRPRAGPDPGVRRRPARQAPALARRHHRRRGRAGRTTRDTKWLLVNLGDSRIYRFTDGGLDQVSVDHSVVQELIDAGEITAEQATVHPERHVITRALGSPEGVAPDFFLLPLSAVERLLLCSDGISRDDRRRRDRRRSSTRCPIRATRPTPWCGPPSTPGAATTPRPSSSMWWDWCTTIRTTPSASSRVSKTSWGPDRDRGRRTRGQLRPGGGMPSSGTTSRCSSRPTSAPASPASGTWPTAARTSRRCSTACSPRASAPCGLRARRARRRAPGCWCAAR